MKSETDHENKNTLVFGGRRREELWQNNKGWWTFKMDNLTNTVTEVGNEPIPQVHSFNLKQTKQTSKNKTNKHSKE